MRKRMASRGAARACVPLLALALLALPAPAQAAREAQSGQDGQPAAEANASSALVANPQVAMSSQDYRVTAGDVYTLYYAAGSVPVTLEIPVDTTYRVRVAFLGIINGAGLTFPQLKRQVEELVLKNYPLSGVQFVLKAPAVFKVSIAGEVEQSSEQTAWALTRLSEVIEPHLTAYSSIRNVRVTSSNGVTRTYDLFKAQRNGDFSQNPFVRPDDKITIQRYGRKVRLSGAVERPGTYELLEGENLKDLIFSYGSGLTPLADTSRVQLNRLMESNNAGEARYLSQEDIDGDFPLLDYDDVIISTYRDIQLAMFIEGAIRGDATISTGSELGATQKMTVTFLEGENYAPLIRKNKAVFLPVADLQGAYILRGEKNIPIDLTEIMYNATFVCPENVEQGDTLVVPFRQYFVSVAGAVNSVGRFPYIPDRTWEYYVGLAGGISTFKNSRKKITITDMDGNPVKKRDYIPPEATITVEENSVWYKWTQVSGGLVSLLSIVVSALSIIVTVNSLN